MDDVSLAEEAQTANAATIRIHKSSEIAAEGELPLAMTQADSDRESV